MLYAQKEILSSESVDKIEVKASMLISTSCVVSRYSYEEAIDDETYMANIENYLSKQLTDGVFGKSHVLIQNLTNRILLSNLDNQTTKELVQKLKELQEELQVNLFQ